MQNDHSSTTNFSLVTNPGTSGSPPRRAPPPVPGVAISPSLSSLSKYGLSVDDIEDFEDEDDMEEADRQRIPRRTPSGSADLVPVLPPFATGKYGLLGCMLVDFTTEITEYFIPDFASFSCSLLVSYREVYDFNSCKLYIGNHATLAFLILFVPI